MTTVKELKEFIEEIPDEAKVYAYEGEVTGIVIYLGNDYLTAERWFLEAHEM